MQIFYSLAAPTLLLFCASLQFIAPLFTKITGYFIALCLAGSLAFLFCMPYDASSCFSLGFESGRLCSIFSSFILFVSLVVFRYSEKYFEGDSRGPMFMRQLTCTISSLLFLVASDHVLLIPLFWMSSNILLAMLMTHKKQWHAALASGKLFFRMSLVSFVFLLVGLYLMTRQGQSFSLHEILDLWVGGDAISSLALSFVVVALLMQSGVWPCHLWLQSSLNSPTPVSAFMHAGLINGGGILLIRMSAAFGDNHLLLHLVFIIGFVSMIFGSLTKMVQPAVKNMLASSTLAQMGFMLMQCGLGLFSSALIHLLCHGMFKAYLFLNSGSALQHRAPLPLQQRAASSSLWFATAAAALSFCTFSSTAFSFFAMKSTALFITAVVAVAMWQMSFYLAMKRKGWRGGITALCVAPIFSALYGFFVQRLEGLLHMGPLHTPLPFGWIHGCALSMFLITWLCILNKERLRFIFIPLYVALVNGAQSSVKTQTTSRHYLQPYKE